MLLAVQAGVACGSEGTPSGTGSTCLRLERTWRYGAEERPGANPVQQAHAVVDALGDPVPQALFGPVSVLSRPGAAPKDELEAALGDVVGWFGVECVGPTRVEGPEDRRLLPREPPPGLPSCLAMDTAELFDVVGPPRTDRQPGATALWGDASAPDPWAGTVAAITTKSSDHVPVHDDAVPATVRGRSGLVAPQSLFQAVSSAAWGHVVSWQERPGLVVEVSLRHGSPADVVRMAEAVGFDGDRPFLPRDALGARTEVLFDGTTPNPTGIGFDELWSLAYGTGEQAIRVLGRGPVDDFVRALEYWTVRSEPVTIGGRPGVVYAAFDAGRGPWGVAWTERDGLIVQVVALGAPRDAVVALASSLVDVSPEAWRTAKADAGPCDEDPP